MGQTDEEKGRIKAKLNRGVHIHSSLDSNSSISTAWKEIIIMRCLFFNAQSIKEGKYWQKSVLKRMPMEGHFYKLKSKREHHVWGEGWRLKLSCTNRSEAREWEQVTLAAGRGRGPEPLNHSYIELSIPKPQVTVDDYGETRDLGFKMKVFLRW